MDPILLTVLLTIYGCGIPVVAIGGYIIDQISGGGFSYDPMLPGWGWALIGLFWPACLALWIIVGICFGIAVLIRKAWRWVYGWFVPPPVHQWLGQWWFWDRERKSRIGPYVTKAQAQQRYDYINGV